MENESILKLLKSFNLNSYEAKSYLALLQKGELTAIDVAKLSGVPRGRVYEVLSNLYNKGLCNIVSGMTKKYKAVSPKVFERKVERKIRNSEKEIEVKRQKFNTELDSKKREYEIQIRHGIEKKIEKKKRAFESQIDMKKLELVKLKENTDETVEMLNKVYNEGRSDNNPLEYIEIMKDEEQIQERFIQLSEGAKEEILVLCKRSPNGPRDNRGKNRERSLSVFNKGVKVKCIYELWPDKSINKSLLEEMVIYVKAGEEARIYHDDLPLQMAVFDSRTVMFHLIDPNTGMRTSTVQVIEHPAMARGLIMLFNSIWEQSEDFMAFLEKFIAGIK
jgi:sugar-specific transcriptional regulator TrmB